MSRKLHLELRISRVKVIQLQRKKSNKLHWKINLNQSMRGYRFWQGKHNSNFKHGLSNNKQLKTSKDCCHSLQCHKISKNHFHQLNSQSNWLLHLICLILIQFYQLKNPAISEVTLITSPLSLKERKAKNWKSLTSTRWLIWFNKYRQLGAVSLMERG